MSVARSVAHTADIENGVGAVVTADGTQRRHRRGLEFRPRDQGPMIVAQLRDAPSVDVVQRKLLQPSVESRRRACRGMNELTRDEHFALKRAHRGRYVVSVGDEIDPTTGTHSLYVVRVPCHGVKREFDLRSTPAGSR